LLISWTSLNAWNESEIILITNIELTQFIKKTFMVECARKIVFKKLYLQMHFFGWHFHCYTLCDVVRISSKQYPRLPKKRVLCKEVIISNWKKECIEKNARKKCCMEKITMSHVRKVNVKTDIFDLNVHFGGLYLFLGYFCLKSTNLKIYIYIYIYNFCFPISNLFLSCIWLLHQ
jgi:hypothetical protein